MVRANFGSNDDMISVGRAMVEQLAAIRRALVDGAAVQTGGITITTGLVSGAATLDIGLPAAADVVDIDLLINPTTDGSDVRMQVGAGGTIFSGATDYSYATLKGTTQSTSGGAAFGLMLPAADSLASRVRMTVFRPGQAARHIITWQGCMLDSAASLPQALSGGCRFLLNTDPIDTLRLLASAGNLTATYSARAVVGS